MTDSPLPSASPPPSDPAALRRWLIAQEDALAEVMAREVTRIVQRSVQAFESTLEALTASGDMSVFDDIPVSWMGVIDERLLPVAEQMFFSGGLAVYGAAPALPPAAATGWAAVVNDNARAYLAQRRNLMVGVGQNLFQGVIGQVDRALRTGASAEAIKRTLEGLGRFSEFRADTIARNEIQNAYANGNWQGSVALGEYGPVEKMWLATMDRRTRDSHADANGQVRAFAEPFDVGGIPMMHPHDEMAPAEETIQCRCVLLEFWPGDPRPDGSIVGEGDAEFVGREFLLPLDFEN